MTAKMRYEEMLPHELIAARDVCPIVYWPIGTVEWHGHHMALGNDTIKAEHICARVREQVGGVVAPPLYWPVNGATQSGGDVWEVLAKHISPDALEQVYTAYIDLFRQDGFKVVMAITGDYGPGIAGCLEKATAKFADRPGFSVIAQKDFEGADCHGYAGDHAGKGEASILWAISGRYTDVARLHDLPDEQALLGVGGEDPRKADRQWGADVIDAIVEHLATVAKDNLTEVTKG